jgi:hypothetical protein
VYSHRKRSVNEFERWNKTLLQRRSWQLVGCAAQNALATLGWPADAPPAYVQLGHDVWQRGSG